MPADFTMDIKHEDQISEVPRQKDVARQMPSVYSEKTLSRVRHLLNSSKKIENYQRKNFLS